MNYLKKDFSQNLFSRQNEIDQSLSNYINEEIFSSHPDPLELFPFRIYSHYTEEGYSLIARDIATHLQKEGKAANG